MKTHYSVTNHLGSKQNPFPSFFEYDNLTGLQKSFIIYDVRESHREMIFSMEDIYHCTQNENLLFEKDIFESTNFLVARIIPSAIQQN